VRRGLLRDARVRHVRPPVGERAVDLVGDDPPTPARDHLGEPAQLRRSERAAERIVRVAEDQRVSPLCERVVDSFEVEGVAPANDCHRYFDRRPLDNLRHLEERHVRRRRKDDRRAGGREEVDRELDALQHVGEHVHACRIDDEPVALARPLRRRLEDPGLFVGACVAELLAVDGVLHRLDDDRSGGEVHLRDPQREDVLVVAAPLRCAPLAEDVGAERVIARWSAFLRQFAPPCHRARTRPSSHDRSARSAPRRARHGEDLCLPCIRKAPSRARRDRQVCR